MPGQTYQIFVNGLEGKTTIVRVDEDATIEQLRKKICEHSQIKDEDLRVIFSGKELRAKDEYGKVTRLTDYKITNEANVFVVLRLLGGSETDQIEQPKIYDPAVRLTDKPDMFTLDDEKGGQRAEMPCGHAVGPESLTVYCRSLLDAGKFEFLCPYKAGPNDPFCNARWDYFTVKQLAVLSKDEIKVFEMKVSENYLRKAVGIQECPSCMSYCERKEKKDQRVVCPICTRKKGNSFDFCWFCLGKWRTSGTASCGNAGCTGKDPRLRIVTSCPLKTVVGVVNCPSVRACPGCGLLIEHSDDPNGSISCKQMHCRCGQKFCFICLKKANAAGEYQCGAYNFKCEVAPVQTEIPGC